MSLPIIKIHKPNKSRKTSETCLGGLCFAFFMHAADPPQCERLCLLRIISRSKGPGQLGSTIEGHIAVAPFLYPGHTCIMCTNDIQKQSFHTDRGQLNASAAHLSLWLPTGNYTCYSLLVYMYMCPTDNNKVVLLQTPVQTGWQWTSGTRVSKRGFTVSIAVTYWFWDLGTATPL